MKESPGGNKQNNEERVRRYGALKSAIENAVRAGVVAASLMGGTAQAEKADHSKIETTRHGISGTLSKNASHEKKSWDAIIGSGASETTPMPLPEKKPKNLVEMPKVTSPEKKSGDEVHELKRGPIEIKPGQFENGTDLGAGLVSQAIVELEQPSQKFLRFGVEASVPYGYIGFCKRYFEKCDYLTHSSEGVKRTREGNESDIEQLRQLNKEINKAVRPVSDLDLYSVDEYWTIAEVEGDCEDVVLRKSEELRERKGWPAGDIYLTVVRYNNPQKDTEGKPVGWEGHLVLVVHTRRADYVLDTLRDDVLRLDEFMATKKYQLIKTQSHTDPLLWFSLSPDYS